MRLEPVWLPWPRRARLHASVFEWATGTVRLPSCLPVVLHSRPCAFALCDSNEVTCSVERVAALLVLHLQSVVAGSGSGAMDVAAAATGGAGAAAAVCPQQDVAQGCRARAARAALASSHSPVRHMNVSCRVALRRILLRCSYAHLVRRVIHASVHAAFALHSALHAARSVSIRSRPC